ncbi:MULTISPECIES: type II secretion system F family protein [unclassified Cryobacterium]|uniref:type II secretion system F family protein n=1 Tax=unclassified Cryobacterium TaxID=2649013 RepID=UPI002B236703|nr:MULTISPECIES: type II secretion system F family protein [unclassified Cryobacterium]MEA9998949.1 type II secretion system F family protein [Cryobacterium sp. RTS3]MEB0265906.1 type II secretion system F family protein [Cryobacterium sp. 10I5]
MVPVSAPLSWGVFFGAVLGLGLWSLVSVFPRLSRPRLADRLAPYLLDVSAEARAVVGRTTVDPIPVLGTLFVPVFGRLRRGLAALLGGSGAVERRLRQSGSRRSLDEFRSQQLVCALLCLAAGVVAVVFAPALHALPVLAAAAIPVLVGLGGALLWDRLLRRAALGRLARMRGELPTILEFLTLSLSAGEGILDALARVSRTSAGELSREFAGVVTEVHSGIPLVDALHSLAASLQLAALTRFVDQVAGALDRGTPLAEVLRAQAQDAREEAKRELLEAAGKKEVAMLVPLVFLILPMTVLFAIFPGLFILQAGL